jgi:hypothetical protein
VGSSFSTSCEQSSFHHLSYHCSQFHSLKTLRTSDANLRFCIIFLKDG